MSHGYNKPLMVWLNNKQHSKLKGHALKSGGSMVGCVRGWVDGLGEVEPLPEKDVTGEDLNRHYNESIIEEVEFKKCSGCGKSFTEDELFKHPLKPNKRFCGDCVESGRV